MAVVETRRLTKVFRQGELGAVNDVDLLTREGRVPGLPRALGLGEDHAAADDRRAGGADRAATC